MPCKSLEQLKQSGCSIAFSNSTQYASIKRSSMPKNNISKGSGSPRKKVYTRSHSDGSKAVDEIIQSNPTVFLGLPKTLSASISRTKARVRSKAESQASKPSKSPRNRRSSGNVFERIPWQSTRPAPTEIDPLPKKIKEIGGIEYCVDNEVAFVLAGKKEQLIALLSHDSGIGRFIMILIMILILLLCIGI